MMPKRTFTKDYKSKVLELAGISGKSKSASGNGVRA
jgi:hypothetical protein